MKITSTPEIPDSCKSTGIPLPSSLTTTELSSLISTLIAVPNPAKTSSIELSIISHTK